MTIFHQYTAYNQVTEGWVRDLKVNLNENVLTTVVKGRLLNSTTTAHNDLVYFH